MTALLGNMYKHNIIIIITGLYIYMSHIISIEKKKYIKYVTV